MQLLEGFGAQTHRVELQSVVVVASMNGVSVLPWESVREGFGLPDVYDANSRPPVRHERFDASLDREVHDPAVGHLKGMPRPLWRARRTRWEYQEQSQSELAVLPADHAHAIVSTACWRSGGVPRT